MEVPLLVKQGVVCKVPRCFLKGRIAGLRISIVRYIIARAILCLLFLPWRYRITRLTLALPTFIITVPVAKIEVGRQSNSAPNSISGYLSHGK